MFQGWFGMGRKVSFEVYLQVVGEDWRNGFPVVAPINQTLLVHVDVCKP